MNRNWTLTFAAVLFLQILYPVTVYADFQRCIISNDLPSTRNIRVDWKNNTRKFEYYALALSWSPQHCANPRNYKRDRFQCQTNKFNFVVHGLWPQSSAATSKFDHPRHCATGPLLNQKLVKSHICTVPGVYLMQAQWVKHGSCAFNTPSDYFKQIDSLYAGLSFPEFKTSRPHYYLKVDELIQRFVSKNEGKGLKPEHMRVWLNRRGFLREVVVCYDKKFRFTQCHINGAPGHHRMKIRMN